MGRISDFFKKLFNRNKQALNAAVDFSYEKMEKPESLEQYLSHQVNENELGALSDKEIVMNVLEANNLSPEYAKNPRAVDEIFGICTKIISSTKGESFIDSKGNVDFSKLGEKDISEAIAGCISPNGEFVAVTDEYSRKDNFGTVDNPEYRTQAGKTQTFISIPGDDGSFAKTTNKFGYISNSDNFSLGTEVYDREVQQINGNGIVMEKTTEHASLDNRVADSTGNGVKPRFNANFTYDESVVAKRTGDSILVTCKNRHASYSVETRNDSRSNESDINVPQAALDSAMAGRDGNTDLAKDIRNGMPLEYKVSRGDAQELKYQRAAVSERVATDPYKEGLVDLYTKSNMGYKREDFEKAVEKE